MIIPVLLQAEAGRGATTAIAYLFIALAIGFLCGAAIVWILRRVNDRKLIETAQQKAERIIKEASTESDSIKKDAEIQAHKEAKLKLDDVEKEVKSRRQEADRFESKVRKREEQLERRSDNLQKRLDKIEEKEKGVQIMESQLKDKINQQSVELERIAKMSQEEGKSLLLRKLDEELKTEYSKKIRDYENHLKDESDLKAKKILSLAIQRCAIDHTAESTISVVQLPSDDMKGRIIGREGRNIRSFETITGCEVIIDDTPEAVIVSSFDPVRREVARIALERLVLDGRIHPGRIEEMVEKARHMVEKSIKEAGQEAINEVGVGDVHPELVNMFGRLKYRTSYGQSILNHCKEVAYLCGNLASELGTNVMLAKRAGLFHDIGKAVDHEVEGTHAKIGAELAKKYNEPPVVIHAIEAHHAEVEQRYVEAILCQVADGISASRPGARAETLENYIKRLTKLEEIANSFDGIQKTFAIQAGREIRIMVQPKEIDDELTDKLAWDIAKRIEQEMDYPGQIKVTVIREMRATATAK
jgi:ribonuclease Y